MVFLQKPAKTWCFHTFWEAGGSGLAGSAGLLKYPLWRPKSNYYVCFSWFSPKTSKNQTFPYVLGTGWLRAGWLGRLAGIPVLTSKKQVLHWFFMVFLQKPPKTIRFHAFLETSKCRISHYSATLIPFAPKCQFHEVFLRSKSIFDAPAQWGARSGSAGTSPARTHSLPYVNKNRICQRHV